MKRKILPIALIVIMVLTFTQSAIAQGETLTFTDETGLVFTVSDAMLSSEDMVYYVLDDAVVTIIEGGEYGQLYLGGFGAWGSEANHSLSPPIVLFAKDYDFDSYSYDGMLIGEMVINRSILEYYAPYNYDLYFYLGGRMFKFVDEFPDSTPPAKPQTVNPTASTVYLNGEAKDFEAYLIGGANYFKLRDLAYVLNGTEKQFAVGYDNDTKAITLTSGQPYTPVGGEMVQGDGKPKNAIPTPSTIYLDGEVLDLVVYNIGGNNFFKLRDLMQAIDVYVGYDNATKAITLETNKSYS